MCVPPYAAGGGNMPGLGNFGKLPILYAIVYAKTYWLIDTFPQHSPASEGGGSRPPPSDVK